ncbi:hypothetical protein PINS_up009491 [Pythium insidiosum]|nr:hypothetical protein PINS_up009491 [Pythium insidiosum]
MRRLLSNMELYSVAVNQRYFALIGWLYLVLAGLHAYSLASIARLSVRHRRCLLSTPVQRHATIRSISNHYQQQFSTRLLQALPSVPADSAVVTAWTRVRSYVRPLVSAFDVTDHNYGVVYILRELVQNAIQTHQAYRSSYLVARQWMNNMIVVLLVLNAWATPLIQFTTLQTSVARSRLLCLACNLALDVTSYVVFPIALFLPYYADFNPVLKSFDLRFWYTDKWLIQMINEWQMLFVTSFWDGVFKLLIAFNVVRALQTAPKLIASRAVIIQPTHGPVLQRKATADVGLSSISIAPRQLESSTRSVVVTSRVERVGRYVLALSGAFVLAVHLHAASHARNTRCLVQVRPWFARQAACSLLEINCAVTRRLGDAADFEDALRSSDARWVSYLIVRHCAHVEITPLFQSLHHLVGLKLFNATLARWDVDAALSRQHHARMLFVFLVQVNMTALPRGLYGQDMPPLLLDIEISRTNLTELPSELGTRWPRGLFLVLEEFQFAGFPSVLLELKPQYLSLALNGFTALPPAFWENDQLYFFNMNGNPISTITSAAALRVTPPLPWWSLVKTNVSRLPDWYHLDQTQTLLAGGTPLCHQLLVVAQANPTSSNESSEQRRLLDVVNCSLPPRDVQLHHYPIDKELVYNP